MAINIFEKFRARNAASPKVPSQIWRDPIYFAAFGFGSGIAPIAPGTVGTLFAIPLYLLLRPLPILFYLGFVVAFIAFAVWVSEKVSRDIQFHDHPGMCIDEFAGFFVTMIGAPAGWGWIALGFVLFRLFDIWKPWPISWLDEHVHGGFGMILDDIVAGLFAMIIIQLIGYFV
jgi:phosphatidylglycerophosphatase A